jgi:hypothetical protein
MFTSDASFPTPPRGDGSSDTFGPSDSMSHVYADGDATYTITATCTDDDGSYTASTSVVVKNVAPTISVQGSTPTIDLNDLFVLYRTYSDPGDDEIYQWEINWGDGTVEMFTGNPASFSHVYTRGDADRSISERNGNRRRG